jgi:hypothetical protein
MEKTSVSRMAPILLTRLCERGAEGVPLLCRQWRRGALVLVGVERPHMLSSAAHDPLDDFGHEGVAGRAGLGPAAFAEPARSHHVAESRQLACPAGHVVLGY